jgi:hypothetical protein
MILTALGKSLHRHNILKTFLLYKDMTFYIKKSNDLLFYDEMRLSLYGTVATDRAIVISQVIINTVQWWNEIDRKTAGLREEHVPVPLLFTTNHVDCPGSEPGLPL